MFCTLGWIVCFFFLSSYGPKPFVYCYYIREIFTFEVADGYYHLLALEIVVVPFTLVWIY